MKPQKHRQRTPANTGRIERLKIMRALYEADNGELLLTVIETIVRYRHCPSNTVIVVPDQIMMASKNNRDLTSEFILAIRDEEGL